MSDREPVSINISAIHIAGVGGLGMVAVVVITAASLPAARWLLLSGMVGGGLVAAALIFRRRAQRPEGPRPDLPMSLFSADLALSDDQATEIKNGLDQSEYHQFAVS